MGKGLRKGVLLISLMFNYVMDSLGRLIYCNDDLGMDEACAVVSMSDSQFADDSVLHDPRTC